MSAGFQKGKASAYTKGEGGGLMERRSGGGNGMRGSGKGRG